MTTQKTFQPGAPTRSLFGGALAFLLGVFLMGLGAHAAEKPYDLTAFLRSLETTHASTIEDALLALPAEYRENYTLLYQGHGLRGTTYQEPGAILFGKDAKFVVTFGSPNQRLGNELEFAQFVEPENRIELYRLPFPLKKNSDGTIARPEKNPAICLGCHLQDPKLVWNNYPKWPGVYGASDDFLTSTRDQRGQINHRDEAEFLQFQKGNSLTPRYSVLLAEKGSPVAPYRETKAYIEEKDSDLAFRPNTRFGMLAARLDARRTIRKLLKEIGPLRAVRILCEPENWIESPSIDGDELSFLPVTQHPSRTEALLSEEGFTNTKGLLGDALFSALLSELDDRDLEAHFKSAHATSQVGHTYDYLGRATEDFMPIIDSIGRSFNYDGVDDLCQFAPLSSDPLRNPLKKPVRWKSPIVTNAFRY